MSDEVAWLTAEALLESFRTRRLSPLEVLQSTLLRLERWNERLNAFEVIDPEAALEAARAAEARWMRGAPLGPLDGIATSVKDLVLTRGWPTRRCAGNGRAGTGRWSIYRRWRRSFRCLFRARII